MPCFSLLPRTFYFLCSFYLFMIVISRTFSLHRVFDAVQCLEVKERKREIWPHFIVYYCENIYWVIYSVLSICKSSQYFQGLLVERLCIPTFPNHASMIHLLDCLCMAGMCVLITEQRLTPTLSRKKGGYCILHEIQSWGVGEHLDFSSFKILLFSSLLQSITHDRFSHLCVSVLLSFDTHWFIPSIFSHLNSDRLS